MPDTAPRLALMVDENTAKMVWSKLFTLGTFDFLGKGGKYWSLTWLDAAYFVGWWPLPDLNWGPTDYESGALTN